MKKNSVVTMLMAIAFLSGFTVSAKLIKITVKPQDKVDIATITDTYTMQPSYKVLSHTVEQMKNHKVFQKIKDKNLTTYRFDITSYAPNETTEKHIKVNGSDGKPMDQTITVYKHLFIDNTGTGEGPSFVQGVEKTHGKNSTTVTLRTEKAPEGTFKILGVNAATGKVITPNVGFEVTVRE